MDLTQFRGDHSKQSAFQQSKKSTFQQRALSFPVPPGPRLAKVCCSVRTGGGRWRTSTKMKGLARYLNSVAFFCLIGLYVIFVNSIEAQGAILTADQLLDQKVEELNRFVGVVEANSRNCDALNGCSADTCSRLSCYQYGTRGDPNYKCLGVQNNTACGSSCVERNFDFSKSFLRRVDQIDERISRTVCTYRNLDESFKTSSMADSSHFFRVYFGAVDGTSRIYPGADEDCDLVPYDPRVRPWYVESTSVPKVVTVLIDSGLNMRSKLSGGTNDETYGEKAITTALTFLDTLMEDQDYVTLVSFDGDGTKPLNATMIYNRALLYQSFSDRLTGIVNNGSTLNTNATATTDSINTAITGLTSPSSIPANYLKVVIVLTTGEQFQNLSQINISSTAGFNLFVYNFITTNRAAQCNPASRASFEEIPVERIDNPLYALQSYFSFLANVHKSFMGDNIDYGQQYADYSGIDNSTLTLSKAAFGLSGDLLGVVGIDFFEKKVDEQYPTIQFQSIVDASRSRQPQTVFDASKDLNTSVCFNHTDACPGLDTTYVQGFLCQPKSGDKKIGCCGKCIPKKKIVGLILGGAFGGVGALLVVFFIYWCCVRPRNAKKSKGRKVLAGDHQLNYPGLGSQSGQKAPGNVRI